jgi:Cys-tRNA(Pro)/Cys-tRNA(Cys) deacylase
MIELVDDVCVSGGQRGLQLRLKPADLIAFTEAEVGDFAMRG